MFEILVKVCSNGKVFTSLGAVGCEETPFPFTEAFDLGPEAVADGTNSPRMVAALKAVAEDGSRAEHVRSIASRMLGCIAERLA